MIQRILAIAVILALSACGNTQPEESNLNIIGGKPVSENDAIVRSVGALVDNNGNLKCSVVSVTRSSFVTAAHCVHNRKLNGWTIQFGRKLGTIETLYIASSVTHENFSPNLLHSLSPAGTPSDIAVIKSKVPSQNAIPVPIFRSAPNHSLPLTFNIEVAGFGRTEGDNSTTKGQLQKMYVQVTKVDTNVKEFTSESSRGLMGCHGDSGAPAFMYSYGRLELVGVVSRGDSSCAKGKTVYSDVTKMNKFIELQTGSIVTTSLLAK